LVKVLRVYAIITNSEVKLVFIARDGGEDVW
jgi:hypothetical protein